MSKLINYWDSDGSVFLIDNNGVAVKVILDLDSNSITSLTNGGIPFLRKIGWDIEKLKKRKSKSWKDLKRERIFGHGKEKRP